MLDKMETGWCHLGGSVEHSEEKGGENVVAILRFLCGSPRLCWLMIEGLVPVSKYWTYRSHADVYVPSKPSSMPSIEGGFTPTASMAALGEKLRTDSWIGQPVCCELCQESFFGSSGSVYRCWWLHERLPCMWAAHRKHMRGVRGLVREAYVSCWLDFPLQDIHWFESPRLSDMSNCLFVAAIK
jgi:hypothetical protein